MSGSQESSSHLVDSEMDFRKGVIRNVTGMKQRNWE